jgi:hypothetical protein
VQVGHRARILPQIPPCLFESLYSFMNYSKIQRAVGSAMGTRRCSRYCDSCAAAAFGASLGSRWRSKVQAFPKAFRVWFLLNLFCDAAI